MKKLLARVFDKITAAYEYENQDLNQTRIKFVFTYSLIAGVIALLLGLVNLYIGNSFNGYFEIAIAISFFCNLLLFKLTRNHHEVVFDVALLTGFIIVMFLALRGGIDNTGLVWLFAFPPAAFFLKGKIDGAKWVIFLQITILTSIISQETGLLVTSYQTSTLIILFIALLLLSLFVYFYQSTIERSFQTLTDQKTKIESERAKVETILFAIGEGLVVVDENNKIKMTNNAFEQLTGKSYSDVKERSIIEVLKPTDSYGNIVNMSQITKFKLSEVYSSATYFQKSSGENFPVAVKVNPINSKILKDYKVIVFRDITSEIEIDRAKSEFVSLASHQLRTPLSAINWYVEMLENGEAGKLNEQQSDFLNEVINASRRMVGLVNALLNVSRIDLGTFEIEPTHIDLKKLAQNVINELKPLSQEREVQINLKVAENLEKMWADPKLINIVFQNLISNAVKYSDKGDLVSVDIYQEIHDQKDMCIKTFVIEIEDTGWGIPLPQQTKIFTKLFRADNVKRKDTDGNGLGLYIVKSVVDKAGGKITFDSQENKGTKFKIVFPQNGMRTKLGTKSLT